MHQKIKKAVLALFLVGCMPFTAYSSSSNDFNSLSNVTPESLEYALYQELKGLSSVFVECEKETGVNATCLAGIAALESGWGTSTLAKEKNNLFGWRNQNGEYMLFESKENCIKYVSDSIAKNYLSTTGKYNLGGTTSEFIGKYYSESKKWAETLDVVIDGIELRCENYEQENEESKEFEIEGVCPS